MSTLIRPFVLVLLASAGVLVLGRLPGTTVNANETSQVVYLHTEFLPYASKVDQGITYRLGREMVRQAFVIAAVEEAGVAVLDGTLRESVSEDSDVIHLALLERGDLNDKWEVKLFALEGTTAEQETRGLWNTEPIWSHTFDYTANGGVMYAANAPIFEDASRGVFLDALKAAGVNRKEKKTPQTSPSQTSSVWEKQLLKVDSVAQFGVVQTAHSEIQEKGESVYRLGVLARAYANLSMLTQHQWNAVSEVFAARALMYAERSMAAYGQDDMVFWNRAYVRAIVGTHQDAIADLEEIKTARTDEEGDDQSLPIWTRLIEPYVQCDSSRIQQIANDTPDLQAWALRLDFQLASASRYPKRMLASAGKLLTHSPTAYGVAAELAHHGGSLSVNRAGAYYGPRAFTENIPLSLNELNELPAIVQRATSTHPNNPDAVFSTKSHAAANELRSVSTGENAPGISWSALAYLVEEEQFVQAAHHLNDASNAMESSLGRLVDAIAPSVQGHRYFGYINSFRYSKRFDARQYRESLQQISVDDPRKNMSAMLRALYGIKNERGEDIGRAAWQQASRNFTFQGMVENVFVSSSLWNPSSEKIGVMLAWELRKISPQSEVARRMVIRATENPDTKMLKRWERQLSSDPLAYSLLGQRYLRLEKHDDALRCLEKSIELLPTFDAAIALSKVYHTQGKFDQWEDTLKKFLLTEQLGLEHSQVNANLAIGLQHRGKWKKAKPYAIESAMAGSAMSLRVASHSTEGLAEWDESEQWSRSYSQAYRSTSAYNWYLWCKRTGRGDLPKARALAASFYANANVRPTRTSEIFLGAFHLLENETQQSLAAYERALGYQPSFTCTLLVADLARRLGDDAKAQKVVSAMRKATESKEALTASDKIGLEILALVETNAADSVQLKKLDALLEQAEPAARSIYCYTIAIELDRLNLEDAAVEYWRRALVNPAGDVHSMTLAGAQLAQRFGTSRSNEPLSEKDLWPAAQTQDVKP